MRENWIDWKCARGRYDWRYVAGGYNNTLLGISESSLLLVYATITQEALLSFLYIIYSKTTIQLQLSKTIPISQIPRTVTQKKMAPLPAFQMNLKHHGSALRYFRYDEHLIPPFVIITHPHSIHITPILHGFSELIVVVHAQCHDFMACTLPPKPNSATLVFHDASSILSRYKVHQSEVSRGVKTVIS